MLRYRLLIAGGCLSLFASASSQPTDQPTNHAANQAVDRPADQALNLSDVGFNSKEFPAPDGFGGYEWNTPLGKVGRLEPEPVYVRVAHSVGKVTFFDYSCYESIRESGGHVQAMQVCRETDGDGFHALAEYYVDSQGFRVNDAAGGKVVMFPITYQFCAHWSGFSNKFKGDPLETMRLCGGRFHFRSETVAQMQAIQDPAYRTAYDRTLTWLIKSFGRPEGFEREGTVIIPNWGAEPSKKISSEVRHRTQYWCRPRGDALVPNCDASIVLAFDAVTGRGQVIFLTAPVWAYAYARQFGGAEGDPLYRVLHGGMVQAKVDRQCMDSFLCKPQPPAKMPQEMLARFRLSNNAKEAR